MPSMESTRRSFCSPILASRGAGGEARGVSVDLAREAARRLGLPVELVLFDSAGSVVNAVRCVPPTWTTRRLT